jgi:hypothetical protein
VALDMITDSLGTGAEPVKVHGCTYVHPIFLTEKSQLVCIYIYVYI